MAKAKILIVEDEVIVVEDIKETLENLGYVVCGTVLSGSESIKRAKEDKPDLVLMDINLQGDMDGIEAAHQICTRYDIPIAFLSSCTDVHTMVRAKIVDSYGPIQKPFNKKELSVGIEIALCKHRVIKKLKEIFEKSHKDLQQTINALASVSEIKDPYAPDHQSRVACLAYNIAKELDLSEEFSERIRMVAVIHDVGKVNVPTEILGKPDKLTDSEFSVIKSHTQIGYDILRNIGLPLLIADVISQHHERLDGSGYPKGLRDSDIYLGSRILAVADVVEAMSSPRPYRPAHSLKTTLEEVLNKKDVLYDPLAVDTCVHLFNKRRFSFR